MSETLKVVREFIIPPYMRMVKIIDGGGDVKLVGVRDNHWGPLAQFRKPDEPRFEVMSHALTLQADGYYGPPMVKMWPELEPHVLNAACKHMDILFFGRDSDFTLERVYIDQDERVCRGFHELSGGSESSYSLMLLQSGRWLPTLADLSVWEPKELRADGIDCPDGGYEKPEDFLTEMKRLHPDSEFTELYDN